MLSIYGLTPGAGDAMNRRLELPIRQNVIFSIPYQNILIRALYA